MSNAIRGDSPIHVGARGGPPDDIGVIANNTLGADPSVDIRVITLSADPSVDTRVMTSDALGADPSVDTRVMTSNALEADPSVDTRIVTSNARSRRTPRSTPAS